MSGAGVKWHPSVECYHMVSIYYKCENQPSIHQHWDTRGKWSSQCTSRAKGLSYGFRILKIIPGVWLLTKFWPYLRSKRVCNMVPWGPYFTYWKYLKKCPHLNPNFDLFMIKNPLKFPSVLGQYFCVYPSQILERSDKNYLILKKLVEIRPWTMNGQLGIG